jgi:hypothetical protein
VLPRPRRTRRQQFVRTVREAGAAQVSGGCVVTSGLVFKICANITVWYETFVGVFYDARGQKTEFYLKTEKIVGNLERHSERARWWVSNANMAFWYCADSWDTVALVLLFGWLLWRWLWASSDGPHHLQDQLREDQVRFEKLEDVLRRQHKENMDHHRRNDLDALEGRLTSYEQGIRRDSGRPGGASSSTEGPNRKPGDAAGWLTSVQGKMDQLLRRAQNPLERVRRLIKNMRTVSPWNFPSDFKSRLSADWCLSLYGGGTLAKVHAQQYRRDHGLENCKAFNVYDGLCDVVDAFVMDDDMPDILNSHGFERIARWGYGLQQVMQDCREEKDWKSERGKGKTRWDMMSRYHVTEARLVDAYSAEAEDEVSEGLKRDALLRKWMTKAGD